MRRNLIFAVLVIGMIGCFASCNKNTEEPVQEPTWNHTEHVLTYVEATEPTAIKNGNYPYYICDSCHAMFADAEGLVPIELVTRWATDYGFDYNHDVEYFNQFANGDEPFFDQIAYGTIHDEASETSLYPYYLGWTSWTSEEWVDFADAVNDYYHEIGGEGDLFLDSDEPGFDVSKVAEFILSVVVKGFGNINPQFKRFLDPQGHMIDQLQQILNKLDEIQAQIAALKDQITINEYKRAIDLRQEKIAYLRLGTDASFRQIIDKVGNKDFSDLTPTELAGIDTILAIWRGTESEMNSPIGHTKYLLESINGTFTSALTTYPEIYDYYASHTIPWEHEGYEMREMLRAADAAAICESYMMCILYFKRNGGMSIHGHSLNQLNELMMKYANVLNSHQVVRRPEIRVCQIPGAQMKFKKQLNVLDAMKCWKADEDTRVLTTDGLRLLKSRMTNGKGLVSKEVYETIYQYYQHKGESGGIYDYLRKAGFEGLNNGEILVGGTWAGMEHCGTRHYCYEFLWRRHVVGSNHDHVGYRNALHPNCQLRHVHILDDCNISKKSTIEDPYISDFGRKTNYVFCNLEAISSKDGE